MLPTNDQWKVDAIAKEEPDRAVLLDSCGTAAQFVETMRASLHDSVEAGNCRLGRELADDARGGYRAVIQFHVGSTLFDWFFNGRTGYRAHYWSTSQEGIDLNDRIVALVRDCVLSRYPTEIVACEIRQKFQETERVVLPKDFFAQSLAPTLSKIWWCVNRLEVGCGVQQLPTGLIGPRLAVERPQRWAAPYRRESDAWLDVYGAFVVSDGLYQPKDSFARAAKLHADGEA